MNRRISKARKNNPLSGTARVTWGYNLDMPKPKLLFEDSDDEVTFKTENEYAKKYDAWREKEEKHKLEQKYGDKVLNSDASLTSDSEDDDEPLEVTEETEAQFLKTLSLLKTKDPRIYDPNYKFFDSNKEKEPEIETKTKTLTFADSSDEDDNGGDIFRIEKKAPILEDADKRTDDNTTEVLSTESFKKGKDEEKLKDYLIGKAEHIDDDIEKDLAPLKALWSDPKLNEGEVFLRDYILNKRYLEEGDAGEAEDKIRDDDDLEADEQTVEEQGKFERAYNFRFEEPDEEYLKRFPRTMNYIRPKNDRRSRKRAEVRTRKEEEKRNKMEEIARLKALKLKEIQEKIARIKEVTGNEDLAFKDEDIEGDFDPEEHDKRMQAIFNEQYYGEADSEKPVFPDLDEELEIENWENYQPEYDTVMRESQDQDGLHCEDDDFNMDADYDPKRARATLLEEIKQNLGKKRRNRKKKSKLAALLSSEKPKFVPTVDEKTYSEYMEEYYKMDCEDVIGGDLPTRFKYREVVPNDYGLTVEEILLADDKELTQWVPLKRMVRYRPGNVEKGEVKTYAQKAADVNLKKKILPSLFKNLPEEPEIVVPIEEAIKKKKKKKKKKHEENTEVSEAQEEIDQSAVQDIHDTESVVENKHKKKKKHKKIKEDRRETESDEHNVDFISNTTNEKEIRVVKNDKTEDTQDVEVTNKRKMKKKKDKTDSFVVEEIQKEGPSTGTELNRTSKDKGTIKGDNIDKDSLKRKLDDTDNAKVPKKRKKKNKNKPGALSNKIEFKSKFKQKDKFKNNKTPENPLSKLSDERLKAFGLNPKKYRSFLKYKQF